jgi:ketosteroid isomerase-like protein
MKLTACLTAVLAAIAAPGLWAEAAPRDSDAAVAALVKEDMAELVAGINAHDPVRATAHEAGDVISMEAGRPTSVGLANDRQGIGMAFKYNPDWKVRLIDETVDVAKSHDMAVYRATYWQDSSAKDGAPLTQKINLIAGFRHPSGKDWEIGWYIVSAMEPSHKR